jgi:hypothetical protein
MEDDIVIEKERQEGKQLVHIDAEASANGPPYFGKGHFRFMDLPAELRVYIYEYLFPYNMDISFEIRMTDSLLGPCGEAFYLAMTDSPWCVKIASK